MANHLPVQVVGNARDKFRDEFSTFDTEAEWDLIATGAGMAVTIGGNTTKYLNINTGVTINSETIIRSKSTYKLPNRLGIGLTLSQRIANQEFYVELIGTNDAGVVEAGAANAFSSTYNNYAGMRFDGVSATAFAVATRGDGAPEVVATGVASGTTAATGVGPDFVTATMFEMFASVVSTMFTDVAIDSTASYSVRRNISQATPDPDKTYKIQIRVKNLGTAPASATDFRLHFLRLLDFTRLTTEVFGGFGHSNEQMAVPVRQMANQNVAGTATDNSTTIPNAVMAGVKALSALPATATSGRLMSLLGTLVGALVNKPYSIPEQDWQFPSPAGGIINTTDVVARVAAGAGLRNYVTAIQLRNTNAVATEFVIKDGATVIWRGQLPANMAGAEDFTFPTPLKGTAATAINIACITTGAAVYANLQGYVAP